MSINKNKESVIELFKKFALKYKTEFTKKEFVHQAARDLFQKFMDYQNISVPNAMEHFKHSLNEGLLPKAFLQSLDENDETYPFWILLYKLIAAIDSKGYKDPAWGSGAAIAQASVRQDDWIINLLRYKAEKEKAQVSPSIRNAIEYLENPASGCSMLSARHRELVKKYLFSLDKPNSKKLISLKTSFREALDIYFKEALFAMNAPLNEFVNEQNKVPFYVFFLYEHNTLWNLAELYLKSIRIKNFQGIKDLELGEFPAYNRWVFLTGENGFGKTSILQAIALGAERLKEHTFKLHEENPKLAISINNKKQDLLNSSSSSYIYKNLPIVAYGSSRLQITALDSSKDLPSPTLNLFRPEPLLSIETLLKDWSLRKKTDIKWNERYNEVSDVFSELLPNLQKIIIDQSEDVVTVKYVEQDPNTKEFYQPLLFSQLASGYKNIIAMIGDMIFRFLQQQPDVLLLKELRGVVLIDEIDLHLHPKLQREIPRILHELFPNIQFIVSTHSAIPILGAPEDSVFLKVTRNKQDGIKVENIDIEFIRNLTPNTLLTSPIFDFERIFPETHNNDEPIRTEDNYQDILKREEMEKRLAELVEKYPIILPKTDDNAQNK